MAVLTRRDFEFQLTLPLVATFFVVSVVPSQCGTGDRLKQAAEAKTPATNNTTDVDLCGGNCRSGCREVPTVPKEYLEWRAIIGQAEGVYDMI
jgi:hypothetical protein